MTLSAQLSWLQLKLADAIIEGRQGEDAVAAVEAEFTASEAQADSIEEIVEVVEGSNE